jgi:hypothetical protein
MAPSRRRSPAEAATFVEPRSPGPNGGRALARQESPWSSPRSTGLVDVLDRVLDKGLVVAGDIKVSLAEVELLTIRIRLVLCSIDKAEEVGLDWWKHDHHFAPRRSPTVENAALRRQIAALEAKVEALAPSKSKPRKLARRSSHAR